MIKFYKDAYNGNQKLWKVFVFGLLGYALLMIILGAGAAFLDAMGIIAGWLLFAAVQIVYQFWFSAAIWRCSNNSIKIVQFLAKGVSILFMMSVVLGVMTALQFFY